MKQLKHENIVNLIDFDITLSKSHNYFVLEFCESGDLSHFINDRNKIKLQNL